MKKCFDIYKRFKKIRIIAIYFGILKKGRIFASVLGTNHQGRRQNLKRAIHRRRTKTRRAAHGGRADGWKRPPSMIAAPLAQRTATAKRARATNERANAFVI